MSELLLDAPGAAQPPPRDTIQAALLESRLRWRDLVTLATDLAFETDTDGRFVFMAPKTVLGWTASALIGQPSESLVADDATGTAFNPFRPTMDVRQQRVWIRTACGGRAMMTISATPLRDSTGRIVGARGAGVAITASEVPASQVAGQLRRDQAVHHILAQIGQASNIDTKMDAALSVLIQALGAEGAAVIGAVSDESDVEVLHECGPGATSVLEATAEITLGGQFDPRHVTNPDGRDVLAVRCETRFDARAALTIWRVTGTCSWDDDDTTLAKSAATVIRMLLEYEALQREQTHQAQTDPLTGLLNRRAFIDEINRQITRLDREAEAATLMFVDVDAFKAINDRLGHAAGDQVLVHLANILRRTVRPFDLITRMGGDEFAIWLSNTDHMTAAERADHLCKTVGAELQERLPEAFPELGISVGIATRRSSSHESIEDLTRRADTAMFEVKRGGRHHWRVSQDGDQ